MLLAFCGSYFGFWLLGGYTGVWRTYFAIAIAISALAPFWAVRYFFPPIFDMSCFPKTVDYKFKNEPYANVFNEMNHYRIRNEVSADELDSKSY